MFPHSACPGHSVDLFLNCSEINSITLQDKWNVEKITFILHLITLLDLTITENQLQKLVANNRMIVHTHVVSENYYTNIMIL